MLVSRDVSGVDLNCGCPKPFSTSGGMGAALLDTPDILCEILVSLRKALPPHISVSCKIRLLPDQEKTLELVKRIVSTGISCLTVHCRTRNMRNGEKAILERLKGIVDCVRSMKDDKGNPLDVAVLANGDAEGLSDASRIREITGADGVMVATKAEENPSCFSEPMAGVDELVIRYLKIVSSPHAYQGLRKLIRQKAKYTSHAFGNTKHCISAFKSAPGLVNQKATLKALRNEIARAKDYSALESLVRERYELECKDGSSKTPFDEETWDGAQEIQDIVKSINARPPPAWWIGVEEWENANPFDPNGDGMDLGDEGIKKLLDREREERPRKKSKVDPKDATKGTVKSTPMHTVNPEPGAIETPGPVFVSYVPPMVAGRNERSPSPERPAPTQTLVG